VPNPISTEQVRSIDELSGAEKTAILVMYLEESAVRNLFSRMSESEIRCIGEAISGLERIEPEVIQAVIGKFANDLGRSLYLQAQGRTYLESVFPAVLGEERAHRMLRSIEPVSRQGFKEVLGRIQPGALAARLEKEHPQTIAVACAVLGSDLTSALIPNFELDVQVDVMMRMARLSRIPLELLEDIEELLGSIDLDAGTRHTMATDGGRLVADTLNGLKSDVKDQLLGALSQRDETLASEVSRQMFTFDMMASADAKGVQNLLKEVERKDLALALKGADTVSRDAFYGNMSDRAAGYLKDDMEAMGPVRLSDVEEAQQQIIALALRLEEEGKLMFLGAGGSDEIVE